ncbi:WbqC family protein [Streptomyces sp. NBC_00199]|uniref:WbqC family protein n=1 Tax=Streptomyces sp. NBC_00199 TaxID=2975678 RepID=UPI002259C6E9|nr:WbqC family protein [Streptomyces sp. NBC_00199]MCX5265888.1 WbqC family protein [Streptomyces sp. NBC_00199]
MINEARLVEPCRSCRTIQLLVRQHYGRSPYWGAVAEVPDALGDSDRVADLARTSTIALLSAFGWSGKVRVNSEIPTRQGRSERLADLAAAIGSTHHLCGTGGLRYLDAAPFDTHGIPVLSFHGPVDDPLWRWARRSSSLWALSKIGPVALADQLTAQ